jgi:hypothetical protein
MQDNRECPRVAIHLIHEQVTLDHVFKKVVLSDMAGPDMHYA